MLSFTIIILKILWIEQNFIKYTFIKQYFRHKTTIIYHTKNKLYSINKANEKLFVVVKKRLTITIKMNTINYNDSYEIF